MSNGQIQKRIFPDVTRILEECPDLNVTVAMGHRRLNGSTRQNSPEARVVEHRDRNRA